MAPFQVRAGVRGRRRSRGALLAGVTTAALVSTAASAGAVVAGLSLPERPVQPVERQVVLRAAGDAGLSSHGGDLAAASTLGSYDVPTAALRAYRHAAATVARATPSCRLPWTLLAGIGRVESDHGRYGGSQLGRDGVPSPEIIGIALDGRGPVAAIADTDGGRLDGDRRWDRAVGPLQFIPGTWRDMGVDGDGDGVADPHDLDDAALSAARYLCVTSSSLLDAASQAPAVFSYNHSDYYVELVLAFEAGYRTGVFDIPPPPEPATPERADDAAKRKAAKRAALQAAKKAVQEAAKKADTKDARPDERPTPAGPEPKPSPKPGKPGAKPEPTPSKPSKPTPKPTKPDAKPAPKPKPKPAPTPSAGPTTPPTPSTTGAASAD